MPEFFSKIVGVTFQNTDGSRRQELIEDLEDQLRLLGAVQLHLRREPNNPHDANAVQVYYGDQQQLGFLSRQVAQTIAPLLDKKISVQCELAQITGQDLSHNYGINIKLSY
ncbi:MAG: HIRAN domain-containing protein [Myxococcota bacterium]|nr:HIRAN domain-containing protein [Myxococcota bacterium]